VGITLRRAILPFSFRLDCFGIVKRSDEPFEKSVRWRTAMESRGAYFAIPLQLPATFSWDGGPGNRPTRGRGGLEISARRGSIRGCCHLSTDRFFPLNCTIRCRPFRVRRASCTFITRAKTLRLEGARTQESIAVVLQSRVRREPFWSYEDGNNFSPSEKEPD